MLFGQDDCARETCKRLAIAVLVLEHLLVVKGVCTDEELQRLQAQSTSEIDQYLAAEREKFLGEHPT